MTDPNIIYFAYGSNMYAPRLRYRVPSAKVIGLGRLTGHRLCFHKRGKDSSGKCNAQISSANTDQITGVLFFIPNEQIAALHRAEGRGGGYDDVAVHVFGSQGLNYNALTYRANSSYIDESLRPFTWYWEFVVAGAREHGLPADYIANYISSVAHHPDPDRERDKEERSRVLGN